MKSRRSSALVKEGLLAQWAKTADRPFGLYGLQHFSETSHGTLPQMLIAVAAKFQSLEKRLDVEADTINRL